MEIDRVLTPPLLQLARGTKTDPEALRVEISEIRRRGYALSCEETYDGAAGMAVPIFDHDGGILASLGVAGPVARVQPADKWANQVKDAARRVEEALGGQRHTPPPPPVSRDDRPRHSDKDGAVHTAMLEAESIG